MSGIGGDDDEVDWLASQFDPTTEVPKQRPRSDDAPAVTPPPATEPAPPPAGGFSWNLRPSAVEPPAQPPAATLPAASEPADGPTLPSAPVAPAPTVPFTPVPSAPVAPAESAAPPIEPYDVPTQAMPFVPSPQDSALETTASPVSNADISTQPIQLPPTPAAPWDPFATQDTPVAAEQSSEPPPTEAYTVEPWMPASPPTIPAASEPRPLPFIPTPAADPGGNDPTSALDALFADTEFRQYEEPSILPGFLPVPDTVVPDQAFGAPAERAPLTSTQKTLMIISGVLIAVIVLIVVFVLGTRVGEATPAAAPSTAPTTPASTAPTTTPEGLAAPGERAWNALKGGECIQPFSSVWAQTFTVVDCSADHDAQLLITGTLSDDQGASYPNAATFATEITPLCSAPTVLNYTNAKRATDIQIGFSYPPNATDWSSGDRTYYCFVTRKSGDALPGSLAIAQK